MSNDGQRGAGRLRAQGIEELLAGAVADGVMPGAAVIVGDADAVLLESYVGTVDGSAGAAVGPDTIYDLSSLTKPLATVASLLILAARGDVDLDGPVARWLPELAAAGDEPARRAITIRQLLAHASGLPAHRPFYRDVAADAVGTPAGADRVIALAAAEPLEALPGERAVYSDLGFMLLGRLIERSAARSLDRFVAEELVAPLGLQSTAFVRVDEARAGDRRFAAARCAPCGDCGWRGGEVRGLVQDENAHAMGGVAGHAGLFASARDVHRLVAEHVRAHRGGPSVFDGELVRACWTRGAEAPQSTWAVGWDTPTAGRSTAGSLVAPDAVGHLGFTGTSVWVDNRRGVHVILLTNRLHPDRENTAIRALRPRLHDAVFAALG